MKTKTFFRFFLLGVMTLFTLGAWAQPDKDYLCFTAETEGATVELKKNKATAVVTIEYSTDNGANWESVDFSSGTTTGEIRLEKVGDKVYFRGTNTTFSSSYGSSKYYQFALSGNVAASGNVMSLLNKDCSTTDISADTYKYCFCYLFKDCTSLTAAPTLPATKLASGCYYGMFSGCTNLTAAPALPATTLASSCYCYMFSKCESLATAPELKATILAQSCYSSMFNGCTGLTEAPALPAKELKKGCYSSMFNGCTNLTTVELPATSFETSSRPDREACYYQMFNGCEKLNSVKVAFTEWPNNHTGNWLNGVASTGTFVCPAELETKFGAGYIPEGWKVTPDYLCFTAEEAGATIELTKVGDPDAVTLEYSTNNGANWVTVDFSSETPTGAILLNNVGDKVYFRNTGTATSFSQNSYPEKYYQFKMSGKVSASGNVMSLLDKDCSLTDISDPSYNYCFYYLFRNCTSLVSAPALPAEKLAENCYYYMFSGCTSLKNAPALNATKLAKHCCNGMFYGCTSLETVPALNATELAANCCSGMFYNCKSLKTAPALNATTLASSCYSSMFYGCTSLETAPALNATTLASSCYSSMFYGCTSLETAPALNATTLASSCYSNMFNGCTSLEAIPELPAKHLPNACYSNMFNGCINLTTAELPATTFDEAASSSYGSYYWMFKGCTSLNYVKVAFTEWTANTESLNLLSCNATGTFVCPAELETKMGTIIDPRGMRFTGPIPEGWKVTYDITAKQDPDNKENYYATFFTSRKAYQLPEGVTAYTAEVDGSVLKLTPITDNIIPAGEGVVLKRTSTDDTEAKVHFLVEESTEEGTKDTKNALTGTDVKYTATIDDYALSSGNNGVGFYPFLGKTIGAHKAYLTLNSSSPTHAKAFIFQFEDATSIHNSQFIIHNSEIDVMYNLNGVRVNDGYKGIVIKNGKKYYNK